MASGARLLHAIRTPERSDGVIARKKVARALRWGLAIVALAFVAWVVPIRDRCWDARSPASTRVSISREADRGGSCVLHLRTGDVRIDATECARLHCEPGVASTMLHARPDLLAALLVLYAFGTLAWAARWRVLLAFAGVDLPLAQVWRVSIEAQAGGILLPGGIGGDALRIALVAARPSGRIGIAVASVLLDRAVGLAVLAGVGAALAFAMGGVEAGPSAIALAAIPVAFLAGIVVLRRAPLQRLRWLTEGRIGAAVTPVLDYVRNTRAPRAIVLAALISLVVAGIQFATIRGFVWALGGVPTAEKWVYLGAAMAFVVTALPTLPGAWGTADAAYVFFLGFAGLPAGIALGVCLLFRLFWYISGIVGAILQLARPRPSAASADPAEPPE
jgi:uncharacterized membrane protein YbhN (UPF0104 family)